MLLIIITQIRKVRFEHERTSRPEPEVEFSQWVTNVPRAIQLLFLDVLATSRFCGFVYCLFTFVCILATAKYLTFFFVGLSSLGHHVI